MKRIVYAAVAAAAIAAAVVPAVAKTDKAMEAQWMCRPATSGEKPTAMMGDKGITCKSMDKMMAGMTVKPTGDVDADFVAMMTPHHQGAIDMAKAVLRYGKNEQIRRIAQEIIVQQQQEIAAMRLALGEPLPPSSPAPTEIGTATGMTSRVRPAHDHATPSHGSIPISPATPMK